MSSPQSKRSGGAGSGGRSVARSHAGSRVPSHAGSHAGSGGRRSKAGSRVGSQAGSQAGSRARRSRLKRDGGGGRKTAQEMGRRTYKFPLTEDKKALRQELGTVGDGWGYYDLIHFKKQWARIGMWTWESAVEAKERKREADKAQQLEDTQISRAKNRYELVQERQRQMKTMRCQWAGFDHRGRRSVCLNTRIAHAKTHQLTQYCGFHVEVCVHKWPTGNACVAYLQEHRNGYGLCFNHYKAKFKGAEPDELEKIPGVISRRGFEEKWARRLEQAMRIPHPLAPKPDESSSEYGSDSDESTDSEEEERRRKEKAKARREAYKKQMQGGSESESDSDSSDSEDEDGVRRKRKKKQRRTLQQIWYSNVKQPVIQLMRGREAATKIQALWRGRGHRAHFLMLKRIALRVERDAAAKRIQVLWQGHRGRNAARTRRREYTAAAFKVQKAWHHFQFWNEIRRTLAAGKLGRWFHRQRIKKFLKMLGIIAKTRLSRQRKMEAWQAALERMATNSRKTAAVIYFQRCWRGFVARRLHALMLRVYRKACSQIGWWYWGCVDRAARKARFELARRSAIKIQAHIRKYLAIKYVIWRRKAYNDAALRLQTWWRGERDRELVRQMLVQVERNWRWLNAGEDRDNFYYALPRAKYGLPPPEAVTRLSQVRRGTLFQKLGPYIPLKEALWMQHLAEGVQYGSQVVAAHAGVVAPEAEEDELDAQRARHQLSQKRRERRALQAQARLGGKPWTPASSEGASSPASSTGRFTPPMTPVYRSRAPGSGDSLRRVALKSRLAAAQRDGASRNARGGGTRGTVGTLGSIGTVRRLETGGSLGLRGSTAGGSTVAGAPGSADTPRRSASAPSAPAPGTPAWRLHPLPGGLGTWYANDRAGNDDDDEPLAAQILRRGLERALSRSKPKPRQLTALPGRRTVHATSLVPSGEGLRDILSPVTKRRRRYLDVNFQKTAPVFREVDEARAGKGVARLWNRPGATAVVPGGPAPQPPMLTGVKAAGGSGVGAVDLAGHGVTVAELRAWEDRLIEDLELREKLAKHPLPDDHRHRRPGVVTPGPLMVRTMPGQEDDGTQEPKRLPEMLDKFAAAAEMVTDGALQQGLAIQAAAKRRGDRIRARRAQRRMHGELTAVPSADKLSVAVPVRGMGPAEGPGWTPKAVAGAAAQSIFAQASLPSRQGQRGRVDERGGAPGASLLAAGEAMAESQQPAYWFTRPKRSRGGSRHGTRAHGRGTKAGSSRATAPQRRVRFSASAELDAAGTHRTQLPVSRSGDTGVRTPALRSRRRSGGEGAGAMGVHDAAAAAEASSGAHGTRARSARDDARWLQSPFGHGHASRASGSNDNSRPPTGVVAVTGARFAAPEAATTPQLIQELVATRRLSASSGPGSARRMSRTSSVSSMG